ncbi:MobF family relaxase [Ekhidna sp.]|jgi:conjugative relaxase-like TrwC/TraI family protein|uniref:MobF family relaxase n=1 Tax=Ekhidna sp. TaxID=2608089 RepID=UPI0032EDD903
MIRMFQSQTSGQAKRYFRDALSKADYYLEDQEMNGYFHGKVADRLNLENSLVTQDVFDKLCDNISPLTGSSLTPLTAKDRRVGYDISFHAPKSVSLLHALGEKRVLKIFQESIDSTMRDLEKDMQTRVRVQGQDHDRDTGELLWADFVHQTARPVDGHAPDPHLHCHCFAFNVTFDEEEDRFKAGQFHDLKKDMPYHQARFQKRLADGLAKIGYKIRRTQGGFEVASIPQKAIDLFSKRTNLIGQVAKEKGITDPKELDQLGAKTRAKKEKNMTMPELRSAWRKELKREGIDEKEKEEIGTKRELNPAQTVDHALEHSFTRASVKRDRQILTEAYKYAVDNDDLTFDNIEEAFENNDRIYKIQDGKDRLCTTLVVQTEERDMVQLARSFRGKVKPLSLNLDDVDYSGLNIQQETAVRHVLGSSDRLTMIRGGAGTGKTTLIKNAVQAIEDNGKEVFLFAPTADASRDVLRSEGFENADTVARLFRDKELQNQIKGQVVWVDEAGMLGAKDTLDLLKLTEKQKARLVLSGDPKQHSAVNRGDAMRILQQVGRIPYQNVNVIYRQKVGAYRDAVDAISKGQIAQGFQKLDDIGSIKEVDSSEVIEHLSNDYIQAIKDKKTALVISPTNEQARKVTEEIREKLREEGRLNKREKEYTTLRNLYYTTAQKKDSRLYRPGQVIQAYQHMQGIKKGERLEVAHVEGESVTLRKGSEDISLDTSRADDFDVFVPVETTLSKGDLIRITKNSYDKEGRRMDNGKILEVSGFDKDGTIKAKNAYTKTENEFKMDKEFGNFDHAYCITSYSAQGKTVDKVFVSQPAETFPASNQKQFYVSVSRGRESVSIYTDNKEDLKRSVGKDGNRMSAHELERLDAPNKVMEMDRLNKQQKGYDAEKNIDLSKRKERENDPEI